MPHGPVRRRIAAMVAASLLAISGAVVLDDAPAAAAQSDFAVIYGVGANRTLHASGRLPKAPRGARALLETRSGKKGNVRSAAKLRSGQFRLRWRYPSRTRSLIVRVRVLAGGKSKQSLAVGKWQTFPVAKMPKPRPIAKVHTNQVASIPAPGQPGKVVLKRNVRVSRGQVIALGASTETPNGLLARVTSVARSKRQTVADTVPTTLPEVLPVGAMDVTMPETSLSAGQRARTRAGGVGAALGKAFSCQNSQTMQASASASLSAGLRLQAGWKWGFPPKITARFEGSVTAGAELAASVTGEASCTLNPTPILPKPVSLGVYTFDVGVPVVLRPQAQIYLAANAEVKGSLATSLKASVTATAGVKYDGQNFKPIGGLTPRFTYQPPTLSASGSAQASLAPTIDVLFYGVSGPRIDFTAALKLQADANANPWWRLTAPLSLGAQLRLDVWKLHLASPRLRVWSAEPQIAAAPGPFAQPPGGGPAGAGSPPAGGGAGSGPGGGGPGPGGGASSATSVAAGYNNSCAVLVDRTIRCWGDNSHGQLGNGTTADSSTPVPVSGITNATAVSAGDSDACALLSDGTIRCWGDNFAGQLGNGTMGTGSSTPVAVSGITTATAIIVGTDYACALLSDATIKCWGYNYHGQLGNGQSGNGTAGPSSSTPVAVSGITNATAVTAGGDSSCAVLTDGTVRCWGGNYYGTLGNGTNTDSSTPVAVSGITNASSVTAGTQHACGLLTDSTIKCWGYNYYGQLGNGTNTDSWTPVAVSGITNAT
ncbi:MAG: hypothetical protein M3070_18655, partial [Actinomycetota bacterium]|nr:hypothetical protein [Actinomycetota bacterium]